MKKKLISFLLIVWAFSVSDAQTKSSLFSETEIGISLAISLSRGALNLSMVEKEKAELWSSPRLWEKDGPYLVGTGLGILLPPTVFFASDVNEQKKRGWGKEFYFSSVVFTSAWGGYIDGLMWLEDEKSKRAGAGSVFCYVGSSLASFVPLWGAQYWSPKSINSAGLITASGMLAGSVAWDVVFNLTMGNRYNHTVKNWYGGWGPKNFWSFAGARLALSGLCYGVSYFFEETPNNAKDLVVFAQIDKGLGISLKIQYKF